VSGSADRTAKLWDASTDPSVVVLNKPENRRLFAVAVSADGRTVVTGSEGQMTGSAGDVDVWDVQSRKRLRTLRGHTGDVSAVMLNMDGTIISASTDGSIRLWSADDDTPRAVLETRPMFPIYGIAVDPERKGLVAAGGLIRRGMVQIWDLETLRPGTVIEGLTKPIWAIALSADGHTLAGVTGDNTVSIWQAPVEGDRPP